MGNVIDYLIQYGDQAFAERAFCDVDVLILISGVLCRRLRSTKRV